MARLGLAPWLVALFLLVPVSLSAYVEVGTRFTWNFGGQNTLPTGEFESFNLPASQSSPQMMNSLATQLRANGYDVEVFKDGSSMRVYPSTPSRNLEAAQAALPAEMHAVQQVYQKWAEVQNDPRARQKPAAKQDPQDPMNKLGKTTTEDFVGEIKPLP